MHQWFPKTLERVGDNFYFDGMKETIRTFIQRCPSCQQNKTRNKLPLGQLESIPSGEPWQVWGSDVISPFPRSHRRTTHVILAIDYGHRYLITRVVGGVTSKHIIKFLGDQFVWKFDLPEKLITDQGSVFMSQEFQLYLRTSGIEHHPKTSYHLQGIGLVERLARTLKVMQRQPRGDKSVMSWDEPLNNVIFTYNKEVQETMRETPFFLMHCFQPGIRGVKSIEKPCPCPFLREHGQRQRN